MRYPVDRRRHRRRRRHRTCPNSPQTSPPEALLAATTAVISDIANGAGVITRERMQALAHTLTASPDLREKASALGEQVLSVALAERMEVGPEDLRAASGHHSLGSPCRRI